MTIPPPGWASDCVGFIPLDRRCIVGCRISGKHRGPFYFYLRSGGCGLCISRSVFPVDCAKMRFGDADVHLCSIRQRWAPHAWVSWWAASPRFTARVKGNGVLLPLQWAGGKSLTQAKRFLRVSVWVGAALTDRLLSWWLAKAAAAFFFFIAHRTTPETQKWVKCPCSHLQQNNLVNFS